jgi:transcription elongation factor S-II
MKAARSVELAAFNAFQPETSTTYKQKMRSLFQNLKIKSNDQLRADVFWYHQP